MNSRIVFICSRLDSPGGTERAVVSTANLLCLKGHQVSILILDENDKSFFPLENEIKIDYCNLNFGITNEGNTVTRKINFLQHLRVLRKRIKKLDPDIIITTEYPFTIAARLAIKNKNIKIFSWEHHHFHWLKRNTFWNFLHKKVYPKITCVVTLNRTEQELFTGYGCKAIVIPNFVTAQSKSALNSNALLSVGWVNWRKGVDMVPTIAKKIFAVHPNWHWKIIGTGDKLSKLKNSLAQEGLHTKVFILEPKSHDLSSVYKEASLFIMTSRFECFPMVLLEAMSFGVPCVSFNCPTGPADIIQNELNGILVEKENTEAMADAIIDLIENEEKRKLFGANAFQSIAHFSPENIYQLWESLFTGRTTPK